MQKSDLNLNVILDQEAIEILQAVKLAGIPEWHTLTPVEGRKVYQERVRIFAQEPTPMFAVNDLSIPSPAGLIKIRKYTPSDSKLMPILIYLHGGGWTLGNLDSHDELCRRLALTTDCIVVSVDYRLAPENPHPAGLDDSLAAIAWVVENAESFGGDPRLLAVGGDSAGGQLSAAVCLRIRDDGGPHIAFQLLIYPALRAYFETLSYYENATDKWLTRADCIWFWNNYLGEVSSLDPYACPGEAVDLQGLPRALIITAGGDPVRDDGEMYGFRLRAAGVRTLSRRFPGMIHGFMAVPKELKAGRQAVELAATELRNAWDDLSKSLAQ
ncbi:acetylhydrolase [Actinomycetes bacterium]|nr:acetylhydrolase [Actinomycetes bacterium]